jgi:hypothetical protein
MKYAQTFKWFFLAVFIAGCSTTGAEKMEPMDPDASGYVTIEDDQVMLIIGGSDGHGTLKFKDAEYRFKMKGVKLGGIGYNELTFSGNVYNLMNLEDFSGTYFSAEAAATFVKGKGGFWMKNTRGVSIHLSGGSEGAALGLGMEGVEIKLVNE